MSGQYLAGRRSQKTAFKISRFIVRFIFNTLILFVVAKILSGLEIKTFGVLAASSFVLTLLNSFVKPILLVCTLPINVLTLGLFTLVINALLMYLTSEIVDGFFIKNFMSAFWGALLFSIFSIILGIDRNIAKNDPNINNNG